MQGIYHLLICLAICLPAICVADDDTNVLSPPDINTTVSFHNHARKTVKPPATNMLLMEYDNDLALIAQQHSSRCLMAPNPQTSTSKFDRIGENMFFTATGDSTGHKLWQAITFWNQNVQDYSYSNNKCKTNCDAYKQMVWAEAYAVGCAISNCTNVVVDGTTQPTGAIVVCHYGPMGDFANEKPYKTGEACSECPEGRTCVGCGAIKLQIQFVVFVILTAHTLAALFF